MWQNRQKRALAAGPTASSRGAAKKKEKKKGRDVKVLDLDPVG